MPVAVARRRPRDGWQRGKPVQNQEVGDGGSVAAAKSIQAIASPIGSAIRASRLPQGDTKCFEPRLDAPGRLRAKLPMIATTVHSTPPWHASDG